MEGPTEDLVCLGLVGGGRALDENPFEKGRIVLGQNQVSQKEERGLAFELGDGQNGYGAHVVCCLLFVVCCLL